MDILLINKLINVLEKNNENRILEDVGNLLNKNFEDFITNNDELANNLSNTIAKRNEEDKLENISKSKTKDDITNPSYWVCRWKDETLDNLKLCKPIPSYRSEITPLFNPLNIITKLSCMIPWWMQKNENMKLYVIKITIKKPQDINNIYYLDIFNKKNRCYRTIVDNNPCCVPV